MSRLLSDDEQEFVSSLLPSLPPVIARKAVSKYLGGMVATQTLSNADASGTGPAKAWKVGNSVVYSTPELLQWIASRYGVKTMKGINQGLGK